jgi:hypothetical protein
VRGGERREEREEREERREKRENCKEKEITHYRLQEDFDAISHKIYL